MSKIILLAVAAAWVAALVPPLLRSRMDRPTSSVSDFRRQLSNLQRTMPSRGGAPMRGMARPLVGSGAVRPGARSMTASGSLRADEARTARETRAARRPVRVARVSQREAVRRRRANVLFVLAVTLVASLFLAATTRSTLMIYVFVASFVAICGYCYKLVQLRAYETHRPAHDEHSWSRAV